MKKIVPTYCLSDLKPGDVFQFVSNTSNNLEKYFMVCETDRGYTSDASKNANKDQKTNVVNLTTGETHWSVNAAVVIPHPDAVFMPCGHDKLTTPR
jgi:hypothetical protein